MQTQVISIIKEMIRVYLLTSNIKMSDHFYISEFVCKNPDDIPGKVFIEMELIDRLECFRLLIKKPLIIRSGYRTPEWNSKVNGSPKSRHLLGQAADIAMNSYDKEDIMVLAVHAGFKGIGFYDGFIHLDIRRELINKSGRSFDLWDLRKK